MICPHCVLMFLMSIPAIGAAVHWIYHHYRHRRTPCKSELAKTTCCSLERHEHSVSSSRAYDPLDPG